MKIFSSETDGFSLVEALVALTIVALLASLASESFRQATKTRSSISISAAEFEERETLSRVLERSISSARQFESDPQLGLPAFQGSRTELIFPAPLPESVYRGAPGDYHLLLTRNGSWNLGWRIHALNASDGRYGGATTLATGVSEVTIEYFGPVSPARSDWVSSWTRNTLPQMVRLNWRIAKDTQALVVRVLAARPDCFPSNAPFARDCLE